MAAFVEPARVELADAARFGDELQGLEQQVAVPAVGAAEIAFAVVHHYFVRVAYDGGPILLNHSVLLVKVGAHTGAYVVAEDVVQAVVVGLLTRSVDEPEVVGYLLPLVALGGDRKVAQFADVVGVGNEVDAADGVFEAALFDKRGEVFQKSWNIVDFEPQTDVDAAGIFGLEGAHLVAVVQIVVVLDREVVGEGDWGVAAEAQGFEAFREGVVDIFAQFAAAVAVARVGVVVRNHIA